MEFVSRLSHDLGDIWCPHVARGRPRRQGRESVIPCYGPGVEIGGGGDLDVLDSVVGRKSIVCAIDVDESRVGEVSRDDGTV